MSPRESMSPLNDPASDSTTLHLPRPLCFHGGGANSKIFEVQCRCLEKALRDTFRLVYVEAPYISYPGPDVVQVYKHMSPFKGWLRWRHEDELRSAPAAVERINAAIKLAIDEDDKAGASGDFVGVLGFSQGAKLAASLLYTQQQLEEVMHERSGWPPFRFGILLAGRTPMVWLNADYDMPIGIVDAAAVSTAPTDHLPPMLDNQKLSVPTLHVHGIQDPGLPLHQKFLHNCCDPSSTTLLEWDGKHRIPFRHADIDRLVQGILNLARETCSI
ncbi:Esterase dbaE [Fulvia fulva]|uniref:Esterase dbaE n=1 Tax=Passalora fulva TaxID=5499 RepID=A0A9Q8LAH3_PASFU|nr:Esterase dbaE [Fulvia fulva]KAK4631554.1 Esterase dbaE [Fulvia fulva]UJO13781.1 Esterase dbaE [Fulvia fulva]WPV11603.1 Esterase dbaE [Fulvia fulva]WPV26809.1 Esterase dbaE [Fulvia fulva]